MSRLFAAAASAAALLAAPAWAQAPTAAAPAAPAALQAAFKGTVVSTYPDGRTARLWLDSDGTYRGTGRRGRPSSGRWSVRGNNICLRQSRPIPVPSSYCTPLPRPGASSWTGKAVTGEALRIRLVPGR